MLIAARRVRRMRIGLAFLIASAAWGVGPTGLSALAQEDNEVVQKITDLNKKALDLYDSLDFEEARKVLKQALDACAATPGLEKHPVTARTHIHMGVVLIAGLKQRDLGLKQFRKAIEIQPDIKVTKSLANPEIEAAFDEAKASSGSGEGAAGSPAGGGTGNGGAVTPGAGDDEPAAGGDEEGEGIRHRAISQAKQGSAIPIVVTVDPSVTGYAKVVLAYRPAGSADFLARDMQRSGDSFAAEIPASATTGSSVAYYVDAEADDDTTVASAGSEEKPFTIALRAAAVAPKPCTDDDEGCEGAADGGDGDEGEPRFFVAFAGGGGFGYAGGNAETDTQYRVKSPGLASTIELAPEVGVMIRPRLRLSVQIRWQMVSGATPIYLETMNRTDGCGPDLICEPAHRALAVLARGSWFFGQGKLRPYFRVALGAGEVRHVVSLSTSDCGPTGQTACKDTVLAGPVLVGPGAGVFVALAKHFGLLVEASSLLGVPKFTYQIDLHGGVAARF